MLLHLTIKGKRQTNKPHPCSSSKQNHIQINACSCECCMTYLTSFTASRHHASMNGHVNACLGYKNKKSKENPNLAC